MRKIELEGWVVRILDRVVQNQPIEDSLVEVKAEWIDPVRAARRLAAHANGARGESILWIVGVDEKNHLICGASEVELADWFAQVKSNFDDNLVPDLTLQIPVTYGNGATVVALLFDTDRAPFLVKNPKGGDIQYEVPWREATGLRTARRRDLIRILIPIMKLPDLQVLEGSLNFKRAGDEGSGCLSLTCYLIPNTRDTLAIPFHMCSARFKLAGHGESINLGPLTLGPPGLIYALQPGPNPSSKTVVDSNSEVLINGPGKVVIAGFLSWSNPEAIGLIEPISEVEEAFAEVSIRPAGVDNPLVIKTRMMRTKPIQSYTDTWSYKG